ncbi:MAG: MarR family winged helix-turn-helix transcriptional regulator [Thermoplasmata archaeon]
MSEKNSALKLHSIIHRRLIIHLRKKIEPYGFSRGEFPFLIRLLKKGDGVSQKEICQDISISKSTTSKMVNKLEQEGYLRMERDREDRRVKKIYLTEKKKEIEDIITEIEEGLDEILFKGFDREEKERYLEYLERIMKNIKNTVDE